MRYALAIITASTVLIAAPVKAGELEQRPVRDICADNEALCLAVGVSIPLIAGAAVLYAVGEALTAACGEPLAPGDWGPDTTGVRPAYEGQWQYVECPVVRIQPVPS